MSSETLHEEIEEAVPLLLKAAKELAWNSISTNCKFILSEIKELNVNFSQQRQLIKEENDNKTPVLLEEIMPILLKHYDNLYDINLYIYKATSNETIIDIRYYPKSAFDEDYRQKVVNDPPMLHYKIPRPPWLMDTTKKFDINWQHKIFLTELKLFWARQKLKFKGLYTEL